MTKDFSLPDEGKEIRSRLSFRELLPDDVTSRYLAWFDDPVVTRYSDNQYRCFTLDSQREYVSACLTSEDIILLGTFYDELHVGCVQINGLSSRHRRSEITYVLGERFMWGKGVGSLQVKNAIELLKIRRTGLKLTAGLASENIGSLRVLENNGFKRECVRERHLRYCGKWYDQIDMFRFL